MHGLLSKRVPRALIWIASLSISATAATAQSRVLEPDDYYKIQRVGDSKISPNGRYVLYTVQTVRRDQHDRITLGGWTHKHWLGKLCRQVNH
jgi:hypothetical protein